MTRKRHVLHYMGAGTHGRMYDAICVSAVRPGQLTPDVRFVECEHCLAYLRDVARSEAT